MTSHRAAFAPEDLTWMNRALRLAKRGYGRTSPNPMVGAILVRDGKVLGSGWHRKAGQPHAEIEALRDAARKGYATDRATLYVTLEPCSTFGRTPPCTEAIIQAPIGRVVAAAPDPNPAHAGRGFDLLRQAGVDVVVGPCEREATLLNEAFCHWIVHGTPWVTVKAAMSLDGKIATTSGASRWITGTASRALGMRLRRGADAILVGVNTILSDDPRLSVRKGETETDQPLRRIVLDPRGRTPAGAQVLGPGGRSLTTIVVTESAPQERIDVLRERARVLVAPLKDDQIDLLWLLRQLGAESVTHLLVEGGGEANASFLLGGLANRVIFFYAPVILGGRTAPTAVGGLGVDALASAVQLSELCWRRRGVDFVLTGRLRPLQGVKNGH